MDKKLTSVHVLIDNYKKFKKTSVDNGITLQKLVNRTLHLYNVDPEFRKIIDEHVLNNE